MPKEPQRHPEHDSIVQMLRDGHRDADIRRAFNLGTRILPVIRAELGLPPSPGVKTTPADKLAKFSTEPDEDGHVMWTGRRDKGGQPEIRQADRPVSASRVAFELRTGRAPVGHVRPECGMTGCVAPDHMSDEHERRTVRMLQRAVLGLPEKPWEVCPAGLHSWDTDGRIQPNMRFYCGGCYRIRAARVRRAKREEGQNAPH